jgi:protein required for attachment to host cells
MIVVINANSAVCRMYRYDIHPVQLILLKELNHPENKLKNQDLISDKPGHYQAHDISHIRGAYSPHMDAKEIELDNFCREIARELNHVRAENAYEKLIVIAAPHMNGCLFEHLDKHVKELVVNNIKKDLLHLKDQGLLDFLRTHTQYHDKV